MSNPTGTTQSASASAAPAGRNPHLRLFLVVGCSIAGTLCAFLASGTDINFVFATLSAVLSGVVVLLTTPDFSALGRLSAGSAPSAATGVADGRGSTLQLGIAAGALSFILAYLTKVVFTVILDNFAGDGIDRMYFFEQVDLALFIVRMPVDLLIGATIVGRARSRLGALAIAAIVLTPFTFLSGQFGGYLEFLWYNHGWWIGTIASYLTGHVGASLLAMAIGAYGTDFVTRFIRRRS